MTDEALAGSGASHELVDHTAELALRLRAPSFEALLGEAVVALGGMLVDEAGSAGKAEVRILELAAPDREALLVDALNEVLFLAETARWAPAVGVGEGEGEGGTVVEADATHAEIRVPGVRLAGTPSRIKGATFHGLAVRADGGMVVAEVILDV
jgi:SHS2 domain-containing protein